MSDNDIITPFPVINSDFIREFYPFDYFQPLFVFIFPFSFFLLFLIFVLIFIDFRTLY